MVKNKAVATMPSSLLPKAPADPKAWIPALIIGVFSLGFVIFSIVVIVNGSRKHPSKSGVTLAQRRQLKGGAKLAPVPRSNAAQRWPRPMNAAAADGADAPKVAPMVAPQAMPKARGGKRREVQIQARQVQDAIPKLAQFEKLALQAQREQHDQNFRDAVSAGQVTTDRRAKYRQEHSLDRKEAFRKQNQFSNLEAARKRVKSRATRHKYAQVTGSEIPPTAAALRNFKTSVVDADLTVRAGRPMLPSQV